MLKSAQFLWLAILLCLPLSAQAKPQIVFDVNSGRVLAATDIDQKWYPASLTKIMTGYLAFQAISNRSDISLKTKITLSKYAASQPPSKLGIGAGRSISMEKALEALFIRSTNDIAVGIAEKISGSEARFITLMNNTAKNLGMTRTHFSNPHGLFKRDQVSTARDLAKLTHAILLRYPQFSRFFSMRYLEIGGKKFRNRNGLLRNYQGADGMKTGFVCSSGYNLIATATRNGKKIAAIMMGGKNVKSRDKQVATLLDFGFNQLTNHSDNGNATIYTAQRQAYKAPFDMRPISCAPRKKKAKKKK
uniref:Peptidase S11 D-alanyl-D-alanine carboxypeptidase A N-terminal domain-containing protein n=1 Tax=OCS116 cluster bacterium TaxID=2030921 RepID=A0A2A4YTA1_9PROT